MDTAMLELERPTNLMVINGVIILAAPLALEDLKTVIRQRLLGIRRFRQRPAAAAGPCSTPFWEDDPGFDIDNHVHRVTLPPVGPAQSAQSVLQDLVSELASIPLDRSRPLWEFHLIEGYREGSALICRIHHSIADGVSLVKVLLSITDREPLPAQPSSPAHEGAATAPESGATGRGRRRHLARRLVRKGLSLAMNPSRVASLAARGRQAASAMGDIVLTPPDSPTVLKGRLGLAKQVAWSGPLPLDQVKAIGTTMGGTVNDTLLAALSGALRRYLDERGETTDGLELHAAVPVDLRAEGGGGQLGNRIGFVFLPLPVGEADTVERLQAVRRAMSRLKGSYQAPATFATMQALGRTSSPVQHGFVDILASRASAIVTNVVGPKATRYLAGAPIEALFFWVPRTGGLALGVSILSYAGQVRLGVITDAGLLADPERIVAAFQAEFEALQAQTREVRPTPTVRELGAILDEALSTVDSLLAQDAARTPGVSRPPGRCQALTKAGRQCKNRALPGSHLCHVHQTRKRG
jgi:WS/DGAT/MGAT family acyltransferase